jgi:hypothetical protein
MKLFAGLAAEYRLDARTSDGQRLETDTLVDAEYIIFINGVEMLKKTLGNGLTVKHSDNQGDGFLFVKIENNDLKCTGKACHRLIVKNCNGDKFGVNLRPSHIFIEGVPCC